MSKYTTELRFICEKYAGKDTSVNYNKVDEVIEAARPFIFDFNYPIFNANYKPGLERKILKHFYTREICAETLGIWKLFLNRKMNEIMPYYNQRYESELIEFNPLFNVNQWITRDDTFNGVKSNTNGRTTTHSGQDVLTIDRDTNRNKNEDTTITERMHDLANGSIQSITGLDSTTTDATDTTTTGSVERDISTSVSNEGSETNENWHYEADTPQSAIKDINDNNYATRATKDDGKTDFENESSTTTSDDTSSTTTVDSDSRTVVNSDTDFNETTVNTLDRNKTTENYHNEHETFSHDETDTTAYGHVIGEKENLLQNVNNLDKWMEHFEGKAPGETYSEMLNKFRDTFLNIDMEIINELNPLFMNLW